MVRAKDSHQRKGEVQYLSGHRYISSTESYLENEMGGLQEEVQQYHPLG